MLYSINHLVKLINGDILITYMELSNATIINEVFEFVRTVTLPVKVPKDVHCIISVKYKVLLGCTNELLILDD